MSENDTSPPRSRFTRHRKKTGLAILLLFILGLEACFFFAIRNRGHQERQSGYKYNQIASGYSVWRNTPDYDAGTSSIKGNPDDPNVSLDERGFHSDQPMTSPKAPGTVRVFVLGGSTAFGAGQDARYHSTHEYPAGIYTYRLSIAGQLKRYLQANQPDVRFEVITAASNSFRLHQSLMLYLEVISQCSPDFIVNLEGFNDIGSLATGTPYRDIGPDVFKYVALLNHSRSWLNWSNTYYGLSLAYDKFLVRQANQRQPAAVPSPEDYRLDQYLDRKDAYVKNSERFRQILGHYGSVLSADGVQLVFALQPILNREGTNKQLSPIEGRFATLVNPFPDPQAKDYADKMLIARYFFDDYLSAKLNETIESHGATYLDLNESIAVLDGSVEVFADYCHLTVQGNQIVAEAIGAELLRDARFHTLKADSRR